MLAKLLKKLENPDRPLLGPNCKALRFWGLLLPENVFKKYFYYIMHFVIITFVVTECVEIFFLKSDMNLLLNNMKITLLATMSVAKVTTFLYWQKRWVEIIDYVTKADLEQRNSFDPKIINIINKYTKQCRIKTYFYWSLMYTTVAIVVFTPVLKYILSSSYRANTRNGTENYVEVISSWVPFDKSSLIGYLAASVYQTCSTIYGGGWITSFDTNAMVIMVFFRGELEMLRIDSSKIFGDKNQLVADAVAFNRLKDCHRRYIEMLK